MARSRVVMVVGGYVCRTLAVGLVGVLAASTAVTVSSVGSAAAAPGLDPIYLVAGRVPTLPGADVMIFNRLVATGHPVVKVDDDLVGSTSMTDAALVVLSSSVVFSKVAGTLADVPVPLITWEAYLHRANKLATAAGETATKVTRIKITDPASPLAAGRTGSPQVLTQANRLSYAVVPATATKVAVVPGSPNRAVIFAYAQGALRADGSPAPSCRVGLFPDYAAAGKLNAAGRGLVDAAIEWALDCGGPSVVDTDGDGVADATDNCPTVPNPGQADLDNDGAGDVCDSDRDGDGVADVDDAFPLDPNETTDTDGDGTGNNADTDDDGDGVSDTDEGTAGTDPLDPQIGRAYV